VFGMLGVEIGWLGLQKAFVCGLLEASASGCRLQVMHPGCRRACANGRCSQSLVPVSQASGWLLCCLHVRRERD